MNAILYRMMTQCHKPSTVESDGGPLPSLLVPDTVTVMYDEGWQDEEETMNSCSQVSLIQEATEVVSESQMIPDSESA